MEKYREEEMRECTFVPNTEKPQIDGFYAPYQPPLPRAGCTSISQTASTGGNFMQKLDEERKRKEEWAKRMKERQIQKDMEECTFRPSLQTAARSIDLHDGDVHEIPGIDTFLGHKAMAARLRAEKEKEK